MEENKYSKGKIYKLCSKIINDNEEQLIYIGSTIEPYLCNRLCKHKAKYKRCLNEFNDYISSYKLFEKYGINGVSIILIENYPCNSKQELEAKERWYIENNICVNKNIPTRTEQEYNAENKEIIKMKKKEFYIENKDKILEY